jgi:hypothetical protein
MAATLRLPSGEQLVYACDAGTHRVVVTDTLGRLRFAFGGFGSRAGQLDTPLDLAFVAPEFHGERLPSEITSALWLAVADYGNRRVQIFELDGCFVAGVDAHGEPASLGGPCALTWRAPVLAVEHVDGRRSSIHLAAALLSSTARAFVGRRPSATTRFHEVRH